MSSRPEAKASASGRAAAPRPAEAEEATIASVGVFSGQDLFGDALLKLPFLRALRAAFPGATITWMVTRETEFARSFAPIAAPFLDRIVERCGIGETPWELLRQVPSGLGPFDVLIDTQSRHWLSLSLRRLPHRRFASGALRGGGTGPHMLDGMFTVLAAALSRGAPPPDRDLSPVPVPPALSAAAAEALPLPPAERRYVALAPGAGDRRKCWPLEAFAALARGHEARGRIPVVLLGPQEEEWRMALAEAAPSALFPEDHPAFAAATGDDGHSRPLRAVALAGRCAAGVANDAAPGHMIAAAGTPLVSLFGPTNPAKFRPVLSRRSVVIRAQDFGGTEMARIPVAAVESALEALLAAEAPPPSASGAARLGPAACAAAARHASSADRPPRVTIAGSERWTARGKTTIGRNIGDRRNHRPNPPPQGHDDPR